MDPVSTFASSAATTPRSDDRDEVVAPLRQNGSHAFFHDTAAKLKVAFNGATGAAAQHEQVHEDQRELPQVEIRFRDLSIAVNLPVVNATSQSTFEFPTIANVVKQSFQDLCAKKHFEKQFILKDVSGTFKAGSVTLVLGRPGSGKSSLMKVLTGRFPAEKTVTIAGDITYNGRSITTDDEHLKKRVPQRQRDAQVCTCLLQRRSGKQASTTHCEWNPEPEPVTLALRHP